MEDGLTIILPVYNEEGNVNNVIPKVYLYACKNFSNFEILIINDGSTDQTLEFLNEIKLLFPQLQIISCKINKGYGYAIRTGIKFAKKEWVFIMDSDGQFDIEDFKIFWENRKHYDFIVGYRVSRRDNWYRLCLGGLGNILANLFFKCSLKDINCGFKLFRTKELKGLRLISTGGCINFEILYRFLKSGKKNILQLPVNHFQRKIGRQTGGQLKVVFDIVWQGFNVIRDEKTTRY